MGVRMMMLTRKGKRKVLLRGIQGMVKDFCGTNIARVMGRRRNWGRMRISVEFWEIICKIARSIGASHVV